MSQSRCCVAQLQTTMEAASLGQNGSTTWISATTSSQAVTTSRSKPNGKMMQAPSSKYTTTSTPSAPPAALVPRSREALLDLIYQQRLLPVSDLPRTMSAPMMALDDAVNLIRAFVREQLLTPWQAHTLLYQESPMLRLGPYTLLEQIGQGGMGTIYKAHHTPTGEIVALKVLKAAAMANEVTRQRFLREAQACLQLSHPNLIATRDVASTDQTIYMAMEFLEGKDLHRLVHQHGPLSLWQTLQIARQATEALRYLHEAKIIHRDIKPNNFFLTVQQQLRLLDLGLARLPKQPMSTTDSQPTFFQRLTVSGVVMGTLAFMAPEQGDCAHQVDERADLYSLGATLFFLLTGEEPFFGNVIQEIRARQSEVKVEGQPTAPTTAVEAFARMIHKLMQWDSAQRYESAFHFQAALAEFEQDWQHHLPRQMITPLPTTTGPASPDTIETGASKSVADPMTAQWTPVIDQSEGGIPNASFAVLDPSVELGTDLEQASTTISLDALRAEMLTIQLVTESEWDQALQRTNRPWYPAAVLRSLQQIAAERQAYSILDAELQDWGPEAVADTMDLSIPALTAFQSQIVQARGAAALRWGRYLLRNRQTLGTFAPIYRVWNLDKNRGESLFFLSGYQTVEPTGTVSPMLPADSIVWHVGQREHWQRLGQLRHPHWLRLFSYSELPEGVFLTLEEFAGLELNAWIRQRQSKGTWDWWQAFQLSLSLGEAVQFAHRQKLAHGQLVPANVLVNQQNQIKLVGVGFGCQMSSDELALAVKQDLQSLGMLLRLLLLLSSQLPTTLPSPRWPQRLLELEEIVASLEHGAYATITPALNDLKTVAHSTW